jgi:tellurium resistance protein TerD
MAVNLQKVTKGQKVSLEKSMKMALIGLGWGAKFDLDVSAFLLGPNGLCTNDQDFVFYGNLTHPSGAVFSKGDERGDNVEDGEEGDDEQIVVDFSKVPAYVDKIAIVVTIYDQGPTFGQVKDAYVRVAKINNADDEVGETVIEYNLEEEFSTETAVLAAEIFRSGNEWKFHALGQGFEGGLAAVCANYGIDAE